MAWKSHEKHQVVKTKFLKNIVFTVVEVYSSITQ